MNEEIDVLERLKDLIFIMCDAMDCSKCPLNNGVGTRCDLAELNYLFNFGKVMP